MLLLLVWELPPNNVWGYGGDDIIISVTNNLFYDEILEKPSRGLKEEENLVLFYLLSVSRKIRIRTVGN